MTYFRTLLVALLIPLLLAGCDTLGGNDEEETQEEEEPNLVTVTQITVQEWPNTFAVYVNLYNLSSGRSLWESETQFPNSTADRRTFTPDVTRSVDDTQYNVGWLRTRGDRPSGLMYSYR